jgi:hypothetical protein
MTEYNIWATNLVKSGSDEMLAYLKANDEEYYTGTAAQQAQWELQWTSSAARAEAAHELMAEGLIEDVSTSLDACKKSAGGFDEAVTTYSQNAIASNGEIEGSVESLTEYYYGLAQGVSGVTSNINSLRNAYINAANAAAALKAAQDAVVYGSGPTQEEINNAKNELNSNNGGGSTRASGTVKDYKNSGWGFIGEWDENLNVDPSRTKTITENGQQYQVVYVEDFGAYVRTDQLKMDGNGSQSYANFVSKNASWAAANVAWMAHENTKVYKFAKGGYIDYTGPAWVDGTKSHPEYMLNATQTQQFETLVAALSSMFSAGSSYLTTSQTAQKIGDAVYNFHINVDQMSSDYDVDQLIDRIEKRLIKAGQYRNVTMVKKTK